MVALVQKSWSVVPTPMFRQTASAVWGRVCDQGWEFAPRLWRLNWL